MSQTHLPRAGCVSAHPYITNHTEVLSKVKKKIIATLCAALMLSGVITGCSGSASSGSQAAASTGTSANTASGAEGKTTLNVLWWGSQTRHEMTTEMLEKLTAKFTQYPRVRTRPLCSIARTFWMNWD